LNCFTVVKLLLYIPAAMAATFYLFKPTTSSLRGVTEQQGTHVPSLAM